MEENNEHDRNQEILLEKDLPPVQERNVLFLGKTGTGKSTIIQILLDPKYKAPRASLISDKKSDKVYHTLAAFNNQGVKIALNIIDTPGLFYVGCDNNALLKQTHELIQRSIRQLSAIVLVLKFEPMCEVDIKTVRACKEFFGEKFKKNTVVVFTCAELLVGNIEALRERLEGTNNPDMEEIKDFCQGRFLLMGAMEETKIRRMSAQNVTQLQSNIESLRHYFLEKIISLPPTPLPNELILMHDSTVKNVTEEYVRQYSEAVQAHMRHLSQKRQKEQNKDNVQNEQITGSWNIIQDIHLFTSAIENNNRYTVCEAECRNILLVGHHGSGKSTLIKVIQDPEHVVRQGLSYSQTFSSIYYPLLILNENKRALIINFIDTPGLGDLRSEGGASEERSIKATATILNSIETCLQQSVVEIHAVFFVHQYGQLSGIQLEHFQKYEQFLGDSFQRISWHIVTKCDVPSPEEIQKYIADISSHIPSKSWSEGRIGYSGVLDEDIMKMVIVDYLPMYKEKVKKLRSDLIELICCAKDPEPLPSQISKLKVNHHMM